MAKTTIRDSVNIQAQLDGALKEAGFENRAALDKLMSTASIEKILADAPAVYNYFKLANLSLTSMIEPKDLREVRGAIPLPENYREYFDNQLTQPTPFFNYVPVQDLFNPQLLGQKAGLKPTQVEAYSMILQNPSNSAPQSASWSDYDQGGSQGGGSYGGGTGKAMSTGGNYTGGTGKAMSTGGSPQAKNLGAPPPPPGMGGGGFAPPPPPPGGAGGGYDPTAGLDPTAASQQGRSYVDANLSADPSYGWFQQLFDRQDWATNIYMTGAAELQKIQAARSQITEALANADPKQVMLLNAKMQEISDSEREITDKMTRAQHVHDEFTSLVKSMLDTMSRTTDSLVKNLRN